jgi:hypothetical protein
VEALSPSHPVTQSPSHPVTQSPSHPVIQSSLFGPSRPKRFGQGAENAQEQVKADYWAIFDRPEDADTGLDAVAKAQAISAFARRWHDSYPMAVRCLLDEHASLTVAAVPASIGTGTPTLSSAPSGRPTARSSDRPAAPASTGACRQCGRRSTARRPACAGSP